MEKMEKKERRDLEFIEVYKIQINKKCNNSLITLQ